MRAAWWWIDRWRKSTAYTDMSAEAQGVYRNLLDELWLREGLLPLKDRILRKIGGDWEAWPRVREDVMGRFIQTKDGYRNETHDEVSSQSRSYRDAQAQAGKARVAQAKRDAKGRLLPASPAGKASAIQPGDQPPSPSPSPSKDQSPKDNSPCSPDGERNGNPLYTNTFEIFWDAYPRKVGKGNAAAKWKSKKANQHLESILAHVAADIQSDQWQDRSKIPYPATWLNGSRWDDPLPGDAEQSADGEDMMDRLRRERAERMEK